MNALSRNWNGLPAWSNASAASAADPASVAAVLVALALIFALPRRLKHAWQG